MVALQTTVTEGGGGGALSPSPRVTLKAGGIVVRTGLWTADARSSKTVSCRCTSKQISIQQATATAPKRLQSCPFFLRKKADAHDVVSDVLASDESNTIPCVLTEISGTWGWAGMREMVEETA